MLAVVFALLLHFSSFGRGVYDIGLNARGGALHRRQRRAHQVHRSSCSPARSRRFAGIYFTLRFGSARGDNATGLELQVIAAVLLGGVSIFGGRGKLHGVIAGVLLIGVLSSALRLEGVTVNVINIIIGLLLVASVMSTSVLAWVSDVRLARRNATAPVRPQRTPAGVGNQRKVDTMKLQHRSGSPRSLRVALAAQRWPSPAAAAATATTGATASGASGDGGDLTVTFLPKNLGNPYFDTSDAGGKKAVEEFGGKFAEVGPQEATPDAPGAVHQHRRPAGRQRARPLRQRPEGDLRRAQRGPRRRHQGRHLRLRHRPGVPRPVHQPGHRRGHRQGPGRHDRRADRRRRRDRDPLGRPPTRRTRTPGSS